MAAGGPAMKTRQESSDTAIFSLTSCAHFQGSCSDCEVIPVLGSSAKYTSPTAQWLWKKMFKFGALVDF